MNKKPSLLIFDINETLLNMQPLKEEIDVALGSAVAFDSWFCRLLEFSFVETLTWEYKDFGEIGAAVLRMTAQKFNVEISEVRIKEILVGVKELDPHPEVPEALEELKGAGYKIVALTNGGMDTVDAQMKHAKLSAYFDAVYSVEAVGKFKPHPDTYNFVLKEQHQRAEESMLIAAHAWDITGGQRAGLRTAFINRPGKFLYPLAKRPEIEGKDLKQISSYLKR